ncbi:hypothetical protein I3843_13G156200 [Carya illinoinensis]|nr:hypothetical protein I3843_13G156200 [Carya illinoinensis]
MNEWRLVGFEISHPSHPAPAGHAFSQRLCFHLFFSLFVFFKSWISMDKGKRLASQMGSKEIRSEEMHPQRDLGLHTKHLPEVLPQHNLSQTSSHYFLFLALPTRLFHYYTPNKRFYFIILLFK